jgi:ankyrin repeat protein
LPFVALLTKEKETRDAVSRERKNKFYKLIQLGDAQLIGPLLDAVQDKPDILNQLLTDKTRFETNALMLAANKGYSESVKLLLNAAKVYPTTLNQLLTDKTEGGMNALMLAAQNGDLKSVKPVKLLLDAVHDDSEILKQLLTDKIRGGMSALMSAASNGHAKTVKTFLDAVKDKPDILNKLLADKTISGQNALMLAAFSGHAETVKTFLDAVKDNPVILNQLLADKTISGQNALMFAASKGHAETVETFLDAVKDKPDILNQLLTDKDGQALFSHDPQRMGGSTKRKSALMLAASNGHAETVKTFLDAVKDKPDILNKLLTDKTKASGENALMLAVYSPETAKILLAAGANHFELSDQHKKEYIPDAADMIREEIKEHLKGDGDDKNYAAANQALANLILLARRDDAKDGGRSFQDRIASMSSRVERGHTETSKALLQWAYKQKDDTLPIAAEGGAAGGNPAETEFKQGLTALNNVLSDNKMTRKGVSKRKTILFGGPDSTFITEVKPPGLTLLAPPSVGGQSRPRPDAVTAAAAPEVEMIPLRNKRS